MIRIDKGKIYKSHGYSFKNFITLSQEEKMMILEWRNNEKVRQMMVNKGFISVDEHMGFISSLYEREDCYYWLVSDKSGVNIGVLDLIHVDYLKDEGEIGFYINPKEAGSGFEFMIECNYFVFSQLQLGNSFVTVNTNNRDILLFNKYTGVQYEGKETIGDETFYVSKHANGKYLIEHYNEFNLLNYARFIKKYKHIYNI